MKSYAGLFAILLPDKNEILHIGDEPVLSSDKGHLEEMIVTLEFQDKGYVIPVDIIGEGEELNDPDWEEVDDLDLEDDTDDDVEEDLDEEPPTFPILRAEE